MEDKTIRCTACRSLFTEGEIEGRTDCPRCGSKGIPCDIANDVNITVNVHELRILCMWADNFQKSMVDGDEKFDAGKGLAGIVMAIQKQLPSKVPLTMGQEFEELQDSFPDSTMFDSDGNVITGPKKIQ